MPEDLLYATGYFIAYSYNFCWPLRPLAGEDPRGPGRERSPAMAAVPADPLWPLEHWVSLAHAAPEPRQACGL